MYAADNNFKMSRTGCLLEKQTFKPITIEIDDYNTIELKGCGSPIGAYPTFMTEDNQNNRPILFKNYRRIEHHQEKQNTNN